MGLEDFKPTAPQEVVKSDESMESPAAEEIVSNVVQFPQQPQPALEDQAALEENRNAVIERLRGQQLGLIQKLSEQQQAAVDSILSAADAHPHEEIDAEGNTVQKSSVDSTDSILLKLRAESIKDLITLATKPSQFPNPAEVRAGIIAELNSVIEAENDDVEYRKVG